MAHVLASDLREAVLQTAIQGKLTKQKNINSVNDIFRGKKPFFDENNDCFDIPKNWCWCYLKEVAELLGGFAFKSPNYIEEGVRVIRISDFNEKGFVNKNIVRYKFDESLLKYKIQEGDILMCMTGGTVGKNYYIKELPEALLLNQRVADIRNKLIDSDYLNIVIKSPFIQKNISISKNSTNDNISMDLIKKFPIPLPPIEEQARIVAKVDELMAKIDEYEKLENELAELKKEFPKDMKASILQAAMEGKLTEQFDYNEYKYGDLFDFSGGSQPSKTHFIDKPKDGYIQLYQTRDYGQSPQPVYIPLKYATKRTNKGDILLARYGGSLGKVFIANEGAYNVAMAKVILKNTQIHNKKFVYYYHLSPIYQKFCSSIVNGRSAQAGFNKNDIGKLLYPLFAIEEQQRIVDKLDQLLPLCDELEKEFA